MNYLTKNKKRIIWMITIILFLIGLCIGVKRTIEEEKLKDLEAAPAKEEESIIAPTEQINSENTKKNSQEVAKNFTISAYALVNAGNDLNNTLSEIGGAEYSRRADMLVEEVKNVEIPDIHSLLIAYENFQFGLTQYGDALVESLLNGAYKLEEQIEYTKTEKLNFFEYQSILLSEIADLEAMYDLDLLGSDEVNNEFERLKALYSGNNENEIPVPTGTRKEEALKRIKFHVDTFAGSYVQAVRALEEEGFTHEEATYAADNCNVDWNEQALRIARRWHKWEPNWTYERLFEHLKLEEFTDEQAEYGAKTVLEN